VNSRRVKNTGRPVYGRMQPVNRPGRARVRTPRLSLWQWRLLILVALLVAALYGLLKLFAVNTVVVTAPGRAEEIKAETVKLTQAKWQQGNLLTLDDEQLVLDLQQADPLLRSVQVRRKWFHTIAVSALLKQPSLGWSSDNQSFLLDRDGTAIGVLPAGSKLPVVNDGSNLPVKVGQRVTTSRFVAFVTGMVPALAGVGVGVTSLDVKDTTLDLSVTTNKGYRLIMDTSREVSDEMVDLKAVLALLASQKKTPAEYIDLRVAGKAYYK
jgi:cell division septal protein FtsQ